MCGVFGSPIIQNWSEIVPIFREVISKESKIPPRQRRVVVRSGVSSKCKLFTGCRLCRRPLRFDDSRHRDIRGGGRGLRKPGSPKNRCQELRSMPGGPEGYPPLRFGLEPLQKEESLRSMPGGPEASMTGWPGWLACLAWLGWLG